MSELDDLMIDPMTISNKDALAVYREAIPLWAKNNFEKHETHLLNQLQDNGKPADPRLQKLLPAMGIIEEVGELFEAHGFGRESIFVLFGKIAHHTLKNIQGIKGSPEYHYGELQRYMNLLSGIRYREIIPCFCLHKADNFDQSKMEDAVIDIGVFHTDLSARLDVDQNGDRAREIIEEVLSRDFVTKRRTIAADKPVEFLGQIGTDFQVTKIEGGWSIPENYYVHATQDGINTLFVTVYKYDE